MSDARVIVFRLTNSTYDGEWHEVRSDRAVTYFVNDLERSCVPTGNLEWDGNDCAEVWVPRDKLDLWRAEHDVEVR